VTKSGHAWVYGDHVDTDAIIPARYLMTSDPDELAAHCMEDIDEAFVNDMQPGDIVVAGENFGCGSSREHAPVALKACGVACIVAKSFARIFFRNAINIGLPVLVCPEAAAEAKAGHRIEMDLEGGLITNCTLSRTYRAEPYPAFMMELVRLGGLVPFMRERLACNAGQVRTQGG